MSHANGLHVNGTNSAFDYVIVGGGTAGVVVASRLKEEDASLSIAIVEAGPDAHENPTVQSAVAAPFLQGTELMFNYTTVPQKGLDGRSIPVNSGKMLSGSTSANYGVWSRGHSLDYDDWATMVGDKRWSYAGMLPFFRKVETHHHKDGDTKQHGFSGPIRTTSGATAWPLEDLVQCAWEKIGVNRIADENGGSPLGFAKISESWLDGQRQAAAQAYPIAGLDIVTSRLVRRVLLEERRGKQVATGIELADGTKITARREVVVSCGALRTPQMLMLSGIGPVDELSRHGIEQKVDAPDVGRNLHDHPLMPLFYRLRHPEKGLAIGSEALSKPEYARGLPVDWIVIDNADKEGMRAALSADAGGAVIPDTHPLIEKPRGHTEILVAYAPINVDARYANVGFDGNYIAGVGWVMLPTSRGSVTLASADPSDNTVVDPNYYATEADRFAMRHGLRKVMAAFETPEGQEIVDIQTAPANGRVLNSRSSDEHLDERIKHSIATSFHYAGTAAMGKVVDTELRVKGVERLRVVDASVFPAPLCCHYQQPVYAVAEQAAHMILQARDD